MEDYSHHNKRIINYLHSIDPLEESHIYHDRNKERYSREQHPIHGVGQGSG